MFIAVHCCGLRIGIEPWPAWLPLLLTILMGHSISMLWFFPSWHVLCSQNTTVCLCTAYYGSTCSMGVLFICTHAYYGLHTCSHLVIGSTSVVLCQCVLDFVEYATSMVCSSSSSMGPVWSAGQPGWVSCYFAQYYITLNGPPQFSMKKEVWNTGQVLKNKR